MIKCFYYILYQIATFLEKRGYRNFWRYSCVATILSIACFTASVVSLLYSYNDKSIPNDIIMWITVISAVIAENLARNSNEYQHLKKIYNNDNKPKDLIVLVFLFVPIIVLCIALIKTI